MRYAMMAVALALLVAGCGPGVNHGPAAPTTDRNPLTGSTGSGK